VGASDLRPHALLTPGLPLIGSGLWDPHTEQEVGLGVIAGWCDVGSSPGLVRTDQ
jgi:hypothetical protein